MSRRESHSLSLNPTAHLIHVIIKTSSAILCHGRQTKKWTRSALERQEPSIVVSVLMSPQLKSCCPCVWFFFWFFGGGVRGWGLELVIHQSCLSPSLSLSLCLIAWASEKVLIMFSFIQTINPEAQCTRVPPRETSHIWQRLCYYHHSPFLSGLLELPSFLSRRCR